MADTGCFACQFESQLWISRRYHCPGINKNLGPDLFGNNRPIQLYRSASRCFDSLTQPNIRGVFRRVTEPAPPQYCAVLDDIVKPSLSDLCRTDFGAVTVVR